MNRKIVGLIETICRRKGMYVGNGGIDEIIDMTFGINIGYKAALNINKMTVIDIFRIYMTTINKVDGSCIGINYHIRYSYYYNQRSNKTTIEMYYIICLKRCCRYIERYGIDSIKNRYKTNYMKWCNKYIKNQSEYDIIAQQGDAPEPATNAIPASQQSIPPAR